MFPQVKNAMQEIFDFIDAHANLYLERLKFLCRQQTIAVRRQGITEGAHHLATILREIGGQPQLLTVGETTYLLTRLSGSGEKTLGFYNHFDTHPPEPLEAWETPPFEPTLRDGALYARGASDNKGNLVARICAIDAYIKVRGQLPINVVLLHDGEEEIGSPNFAAFLNRYTDQLKDVDGWVWEGGFKDTNEQLEVYLGFNGILYVELEVITAAEESHGSHAGMIPNAAWRLIWALNSLKDMNEKITIRDFYRSVIPAAPDELDLLKSITFNLEEFRRLFRVNRLAGDSSLHDALERQYLYPYINIAGVQAGSAGEGMEVILPHRAMAKVEIYLVPNQDPDDMLMQLRSHFDTCGFADVQINPLAKMPPSRTSPSVGLARAVVDLIGRLYEKPAVLYPIMPGASPMGYITGRFGVPGVSTGVGYANSRIHQPNENVRIHDFIQGIKLIAALVDSMSQSGRTWN